MRWWVVLCILVLLAAAALADETMQADKRYAMAAGFYNRELYEFAAEEYQRFLDDHPRHKDAPRAELFLAKSLARSGKDDEARKLLAKLSKSPQVCTAAESELELGRLDFGASKFESALTHFQHAAADEAPADTRSEAILALAETKFQMKDYVGAEDLYRKIVTSEKKGARSVTASYGLAWSLYQKGEIANARAAFEHFAKTFASNPAAVEAILLRADCLLQEKKWDDAYRAYDEAFARDQRCLDRAQFGKGRACYLKGDIRRAAQEFARLMRKCPQSELKRETALALAETYLRLKDYGKTLEALKNVPGPDKAERPPEADFMAGQASLGLGRPEDAAASLSRAVKRAPKTASWSAEARLCYGSALIGAGDHRAAEAVYRALGGSHGSSPLAARILLGLAKALHHQDRYEESLGELGKLRKKLEDEPAAPEHAFLEAENLFFLGDYAGAEKLYAGLRKTSPRFESARVSFRLAWCLFYGGKLKEAHAAAAALLREKCGDEVRESLSYLSARSLCGLQRYDEAAKAFEQAYSVRKGQGRFAEESLFYRGKCLSARSRLADAGRAFGEYEKKYPKGRFLPQVRLETASIAMNEKKYDEAVKLYTALLSSKPDGSVMPYVLYGMAGSLYKTGNAPAAAERYREAREKFPKHTLAPASLLGQAMALSGNAPDRAAALYREYLKAYGDNGSAFEAYLGLARVCRKLGGSEAALAALEGCLKNFPRHPELWIVLGEQAEVLSALGRQEEALAAYRRIREKFGGAPYAARAAYELAEAELANEKLDPALVLFLEAEKLDKKSALGAPLLYRIAWIYWRKKQTGPADKYFGELARRYPKDDLALRGLVLQAETLFDAGKYEECAAAMENVTKREGNPPLLDRALLRQGDSYGKLSRWQDSLKCYQDLLARVPESPFKAEAHFGIGTALQNTGKLKEALAAYGKATGCGSAPTAAKARFMAGQCYFHMGNFDRAAKETLKVPVLAPKDTLVFPALLEAGKCFEKLERWKEAAQLYREILSKNEKSKWAQTAQTRLAALKTKGTR